jgi:hypothetical protein
MRLLRQRWVQISLGVCVFFIALVAYAAYALDQFAKGKEIRTTTATVTGKESFQCKEQVCTFVGGYGDVHEMKHGETQQRIYYRIDNFDQFEEPMRSRLLKAEKERIAKTGSRFTYGVNWFDSVEVGDKIDVGYRAFSSGQIQIWSERRRD